MSPAGFEPAVSVFKRPKVVLAFDFSTFTLHLFCIEYVRAFELRTESLRIEYLFINALLYFQIHVK